MKNNLRSPLSGLLLLLILLISSCTTSTYEDLIPVEETDPSEIITYQDVRSTFDNICSACHTNPPQNSAPMPLVTYLNVKEAVLNRDLLDRISRNEGADGLMPFGGPRLPQQTIDKIFQWNEDGLLEN